MPKSTERTGPCALFMAFGTKGDVYPIAALAAAFACDQRHYQVQFVTHSAHENLEVHLGAKGVTFFPVSSLPVLSVDKHNDHGESGDFSQKKKEITRKHRQECLSIVDKVYGDGAILDGDLIAINFFALEGWSLAELFRVRCVVAAPYVVPYSAPSSFERQFKTELPLLYQYLQEAPSGKICWGDIMQWMWPLFTDDWGIWRNCDLHLSFWPFTDPVTSLPTWHDRPASPLLLYGFSREIVDCPGYWPSAVRVCGFWFLPLEWQFSCPNCSEMSSLFSSSKPNAITELCPTHTKFKHFLDSSDEQPIFISFSSIGSMGYIRDPKTFLLVLETVIRVSSYRFILFSAGYEPLDAAIEMLANKSSSTSQNMQLGGAVNHLFNDGRLLCFSGEMPYRWLFPQCAAVIHHGGSGSTAAALHAGVPQVICPFILDQFYWAERMHWLGVSPEPLKTSCLFPANENSNSLVEAATALVIAIDHALSSNIKTNAARLSTKLAAEDGVSMAMEIIKNEILHI